MNEKESLRKRILEIRNSLTKREVEEKSERISAKFLEIFEKFDKFLLYYSINSEVRTNFIIDTLSSNGKEVFLPKYVDGEFLACLYEGDLNLKRGKFGVMEPISDVSETEFDAIAVPGVVFGRDFNRIGMGKGYYDVMLKKLNGLKVGLAYQFQMVDGIDADPWDVKMDMIITEENIYRR